jgi:biotin carboxylase
MSLVVFVASFFEPKTLRYLDAILGLPGVRLAVISQASEDDLPEPLRARLADHVRVEDAFQTDALTAAARHLAHRHGPIHRLLAINEFLQVQVAEARARLDIAGMRPDIALNFRDKSRMKAALRAAGVPCARHRLVTSVAEARAFADEIGFPLVVKPPSGADSASTHRVEDHDALGGALHENPPGKDRPVLLEEFITGHEHSFDTMSLEGRPLWSSISRYYPNPLEVMTTPWIQWCVIIPREVDDPVYDDIRHHGARALAALGMDTGMSHTEWFRRRDGSVAISEIGARPPGAQFSTIISRAHDFDLPAAWARLVIEGAFEPPARKYAAGAAYLRGQGQGIIRAVHGLEEADRELGHLVTDVSLPQPGKPHVSGYQGDGYVILRHPETRVVEEALQRLVSLVRVEVG